METEEGTETLEQVLDEIETIEPDTENKMAGKSLPKAKINPLSLIDQFPDEPSLDQAREFWSDWIEMIQMMFTWNPKIFPSDQTKMSVLLAKGGGFIRKILATKLRELSFDQAAAAVNDYFESNSNPLADEAVFRQITQKREDSFEKFADKVVKKARVLWCIFGIMDEKRIISQVTAGAIESQKLTDFSLRGGVILKGILAYGNQLEALNKLQVRDVLPQEVNEIRDKKRSDRFMPYDKKQQRYGRSKPFNSPCG